MYQFSQSQIMWWISLLLGPISSMFYEQFLHLQIPNAQKKTDNFTVFFALLGSAFVKAT